MKERNNSCYNLHAAVGVHCNHTNLLTLGYPVTMTSPPDLHRPCAADHLPEAAFCGLEIVLVVVVVSDIECNVPVFCPGSPKRNWPRHLKTKQEILNMILCIINQEKWNRTHLCVHACVCVYVCAHVYALWQSITHKPIKVYI